MKSILCLYFLFFSFISFAQEGLKPNEIQPEKKVLNGGWYPWEPYQFQVGEISGSKRLSGLDIEFMKALAKRLNRRVRFKMVYLDENLRLIKEGKLDFFMGATFSTERGLFGYFTRPYRQEKNSIFANREKFKNKTFNKAPEFLEYMTKNDIKLAVVKGYRYADFYLNEFIANEKNHKYLVFTKNDLESLDLITIGFADAFIADKLVGASMVWELQQGNEIREIELDSEVPLRIFFGQKTISLELLNLINTEIGRFMGTDEYKKIIAKYYHPAVVLKVVQSNWFKIIEFIGIIAFSLSGILIALRQNTSVFGAYIFALLPSLGGGIMRDLIIGKGAYGQMIKTEYLVVVAAVVVFSFLCIRLYNMITKKTMSPNLAKKFLAVFDGVGLSCFTAVGVVVAVISRQEPIYLWGPFLAFITAAGGATLRDVLREDNYVSAVAGGFYAEVPLLWGLIPSLYLYFNVDKITEDLIFKGILFVVIGAFVTRALFLAFGLKSIPLSALRRSIRNKTQGGKNVK